MIYADHAACMPVCLLVCMPVCLPGWCEFDPSLRVLWGACSTHVRIVFIIELYKMHMQQSSFELYKIEHPKPRFYHVLHSTQLCDIH